MIIKPKRVAVVGTQGIPAHYGGFETFAENLVRYNSSKEIEYTIFCSSKDLPTHLSSYRGAKLKYIPLHSNGVESILYDFFSLLRAIKGYDVILVLGISGCLFIPIIKLLSSAKIIVNIDGLEHRRKKWNGISRWYLRLSEHIAVRFANTIVADNKAIQDYITETYRKPSKLIAYGGDQVLIDVSEEKQDTFLKLCGLTKGKYALTVCRIEPENNINLILDAFAGISQKIAVVGNLHVSPYAIDLVAHYKPYRNIFFIDAIYDLDLLFILRHNANFFVHGHSAGGTNPSLVEAMFFGHPILAYDINYNRETTSNLAEYFSNKEELRQLISQNNHSDANLLRQVAMERYTWEAIVQQYEQLF